MSKLGAGFAVATGALLAVSGCSSTSHRSAPRTTTTARRRSTTSGSTPTTVGRGTTTTNATLTTTVSTTPPAGGPIPAPDATAAAEDFFAAWIAHDATRLAAYGTADA